MTTKHAFTAIMTGAICLAVCVFSLWQSSSAFAQCGSPQPSSCITCHAEKDPVIDRGEWHSAHASKDLCINCHGGNGSATDENLAHKDMLAQPLSDIYTNCHSCHPDYVERAVPYAATLRITPSSCATPTPVAAGNVSNGRPPNGMVAPSNLMGASAQSQSPFMVISIGLLILAFFFLCLGWLARHPAED